MKSLPIWSRWSRPTTKKSERKRAIEKSHGCRLGAESLETRAVFSATALTPDLDLASDTGFSQIDNRTSDTTPTFSVQATGDAAAINLVRVTQVGKRTVTTPIATTSTGGGASPLLVTVSTPLAAGRYSIAAQAVNSQGVAGPVSRPITIEIGTAAPRVPSISLDVRSDTGFRNDRITNQTSPLLVGRGQAGTVVVVSGPGIAGGSQAVAVNRNGGWAIRPAGLANGSHDFTAKAVNVFGVESAAAPLRITVDTVQPLVASMQYLGDNINEIEIVFSRPVTGVDASDFRLTAQSYGLANVPLNDPRIRNAVGGIVVRPVADSGGTRYRLAMVRPEIMGGVFEVRLIASKSGIFDATSGNPLLLDKAVSATF
jgi:hypothetical protein